jgi:hypothetical protein
MPEKPICNFKCYGENNTKKCIVYSTYCTCLKWCTIGIMISSDFALIVTSSQAKAYGKERPL